jgi:hypothetical protein
MQQVDAPDPGLLALWQQHSQLALPLWRPQQLPLALAALAGLGFAPGPQWMQALYGAVAACWRELTSAELAQLAAALAALQQQPPEAWMERLCSSAQQRLEDELAGRAAAARPEAAAAARGARQPPGPAVLLGAPAATLAAQLPRRPGGGPPASLEPGAELVQPLALQRHAAARLSELLRALGALGYLPDEAWLAWACQLLQKVVSSGASSADGLLGLLEAWAELGIGSHPELLEALYLELGGALQELGPAQLCRLGQALQRQQQQQQQAPAAWLEAWQQALAASMPDMSSAQLCSCVQAVHTLQLRPSCSWVSALCLVSQGRLHALDPEQLVGLVRALGLQQAQVSPLWAGAVLGHVAAAVGEGQGGWDAELLLALLQGIEQLQTDAQFVRVRYVAELQQLQQAAGVSGGQEAWLSGSADSHDRGSMPMPEAIASH